VKSSARRTGRGKGVLIAKRKAHRDDKSNE
jgi:hypothetical protein